MPRVLTILAIVFAFVAIGLVLRMRRHKSLPGHCPECGHALPNVASPRCPACGESI